MNFIEGPEVSFDAIKRGDRIAIIREEPVDEFEIDIIIVKEFSKFKQEWKSVTEHKVLSRLHADEATTTLVRIERNEMRFPPEETGQMIIIKKAYSDSDSSFEGSTFAVKTDLGDSRWFSPVEIPAYGHWHHDDDIQEWEFAAAMSVSDFNKMADNQKLKLS